jgi:tetratricopeptide (TPR) repeat protein
MTMCLLPLVLLLLPRGLAVQCVTPPDRETAHARFEELEKAAQEAFQKRDFARAAENLRRAICFDSTSARAYHELGLAEAAAGHFPDAEQALALAQSRAPSDFGILLTRAQVELSLKKPDAARPILAEARRYQPKDSPAAAQSLARIYSLLGRAYLEHRQPDLAIAALLRAAHTDTPESETLLFLATLENSEGAYADAIHNAELVMSADSTPEAQKGAAAGIAGLAYKNQRRNDNAIRLLRQAIQVAPTQTILLALAEIYETEGKPGDAAQVLRQARLVFPDSAKIALALGRNLANAGETAGALQYLSECTRRTPDDPECWRWQAEVQTSLGQMTEAAESLEQIVSRTPHYPMIYTMLAQALLKIVPPHYDAALRILEQGAKAAPSDPEIYYMRGKILAEVGRYGEAKTVLERAVQLGPTMATPYYQLGLVYRKLGLQSQADDQFERFKFFKGAARE